MWYKFPNLPGRGSRMEPLPLTRQDTSSQSVPGQTVHGIRRQPQTPNSGLGHLFSFCSSPCYSFPMTDGIPVFSVLPTFLFFSLLTFLMLFIPANMSCCFSAKQLFPLPLLSPTSFSRAFQDWAHCKPRSHTLSSFIVVSWIVTIWIPFPFPRGKALSGVCSTQPRIRRWHSINNILWW